MIPPVEVNHTALGMTYNNMYSAVIEKLFPSQVPTLLLIILKRLSSVQNPDYVFFQLKSKSNFIKESAIRAVDLWIRELTL